MIQNHPPTPVRNSKYLIIPPPPPFTLTWYKNGPLPMFSLFSSLHFDKIRSVCKTHRTAVQTVLSAGGRPSLSTPTLVARARGVETSGEPLTAASLSVHAKRSSRLLFFCEIAESSRKLPFQSKKSDFLLWIHSKLLFQLNGKTKLDVLILILKVRIICDDLIWQ